MNNVKTAVSLQKSLFEQVDAVAAEMKVSRSRLVALALEDFLRRYRNRQLLEQINAAYDNVPDAEEEEFLRRALRHQKQIVEGEW